MTCAVLQVTDLADKESIFSLLPLRNSSAITDYFMGVTAYNVATSTMNDPTPSLTVFFGLSAMIVVCAFLIYRGLYDEKRTLLLAVARNVSRREYIDRFCLLIAGPRAVCFDANNLCQKPDPRLPELEIGCQVQADAAAGMPTLPHAQLHAFGFCVNRVP